MKKFLFYFTSVFSAVLLSLPFAIGNENIYSLEGLLKLKYYWNTLNIVQLSVILVLVAIFTILLIKCVHLFINGIPQLEIHTHFFEYTSICKIKFYRMSRYKWIFPIVIILTSLIVIQSTMQTHQISFGMRWFEKHSLVAHAAGGIDLYSGTNTLEAFEENYKKGHRVFEIDICMTADNFLIAEHDWKTYYSKLGVEYENEKDAPVPLYNDFISTKVYENGKYTTLDMPGIINLMIKYDDAYVMTDFKHWYDEEKVKSAISQIVDSAIKANHPEVLDRIIVQLYHYDFLEWVNSVYEFDNYLFTCYAASKEEREINNLVNFCKENNIPVITMWPHWLNQENSALTRENNIRIYVHTENDLSKANEYILNGASGVYTDFLTEDQVIIPEMNK